MTRDRAARIAAPLVAAALVFLATAKRGPALSPDSAVYLSVADHLAHGRGWVQFDGAPYVRWAPIYPLLLSLGPRLGLAAATVARVLQPVFWAGTVALAGAWLGRHVRAPGWRVAALALVALSTIGIESAAFVWAESLDGLLALGCLVALDRWAETGRGRTLVMAALCAALACLTRYASLVLVPVGALTVLLAATPRPRALRERLGAAAGFALVAALPLIPWLARNAGLGEGLVGSSGASGFSWFGLAAQAGNAASHWVAPESSPVAVRATAVTLFALAAVVTLVAGFMREPRGTGAWFAPGLLLAFMGAHKLAVIAGAHTAAVERIDERYLAPLFVPLVLVLAWAADRATMTPARTWDRRALGVLAVLWIAFTALRTADRERGYLGDGAWGWNNARWENSELLAAVRRSPPKGLVYSNAPDLLYAQGGTEARLWPRLHAYNSPRSQVDDRARYFADVDSAGGATVIWLNGVQRSFLWSPSDPDLLRPFGRSPVTIYGDGALYTIIPREPEPPRPGPRL